MGLDSNGTKFLFAANAAGASFSNTIMLGRQNFFPDVNELQHLFDLRKSRLSARDFLADSGDYAEKFFAWLGANEVASVDNSSYEGATFVADLNAPFPDTLKDRFTAVFDGGCLEHIFNFPQAIKNCMEMLKVGGHFLGITPANNFCGHGFYQFSPELYFRVFCENNGFKVSAILTKEKDTWFRIMDPEEFGGRVELQNNRATYLFVLAQKIEARAPFLHVPQQSDYARRWKEDASERPTPPASATFLRDKVRAWLPPTWKDKLRPLAATLSIRRRYACYRPINEGALLQGQLGND
ncbi:MAG: hypothetical protein H0X40_07015 [Chthoniobacterales bacterium]|nr:hypothetical protein [Chthoniobacterales bacterium]